jgi:hypothetical protein
LWLKAVLRTRAEAVTANAKRFKAVDYMKLIALFIEAMKEQQTQIKEQGKMIQQHLNK